MHINTVRDFVEGFSEMSEFDIEYLSIDNLMSRDFSIFQCLVLHYAVRLTNEEALPKNFIEKLENYTGIKSVFLQDEYEYVNNVRKALIKIKPSIVFTCIPASNINIIYPFSEFPNTTFINVLTGFAPSKSTLRIIPYSERPIDLGYRGRKLGSHYGKLGFEKSFIAEKSISILLSFPNLKIDISTNESERLYGDDWLEFLGNCKAVLGSESGSNVFDFEGKLKKEFDANPSLSYSEFEQSFLQGKEIEGFMNQISPRIFEAASTHTAQVLFKGNYSGLIQPWIHFLPLEKDFSNFDEILRILESEQKVKRITDQIFSELIQSGKYSRRAYFAKIQIALMDAITADGDRFFSETESALTRKSAHQMQFEARISVANLQFPGRGLLRWFWLKLPIQKRIRIITKFDFALGTIFRILKSK